MYTPDGSAMREMFLGVDNYPDDSHEEEIAT
jgi:hypothetical protein